LGDGAVGHAEQVLQRGGGIPMLGEGELAARPAQTIDDLDGDNVSWPDVFFALRQVPRDDVVEADIMPQPACQPDIAEAAGIGPANVVETNADDIGIVGESNSVVFGEEAKLLGVAVAVVENDDAMPAAFL